MTIAFELLIFAAVFAVAIALFSKLATSRGKETRKRLATLQSRRFAQQPWDVDKANRRGNR